MRYLLDTNTVSDFIKHPRGHAAMRIREVGLSEVCTSIIVAAELRFGAVKKQSLQLMGRIEEALDAIQVLPFAAPADAEYTRLRAMLERRGQPIGGNDLFIAAHALALGCCVVTGNTREFARIADLPFENCLR
jgi:tRNA(fMet)-specific endonuclease VapC